MKNSPPIQMTVQTPDTEAGRQELARRVAELHADAVADALAGLPCPPRQKLELLQAVMDAVREAQRPAGPSAPRLLSGKDAAR